MMRRVVSGRRHADLRQTGELVAGAVATAVLTFSYVLWTGRLLGPAAYADFSAALSVLYFVSIAFSPLMPTTARLVTRYRVRGDHAHADALEREVLSKVIRWSAIAGIPMLIAAIPLSRIFKFASPFPLVLALASAVIYMTVSVRRGVLQGLGRFRGHVVNTVLESALRLGIAVAILKFVKSSAASLTAYLVALLIADLLLRRRVDTSGTANWNEVWQLAKPMLVAMIGVAVYQHADVLAVKRWFPAATAGHYSAASTLARSITVLFVPIYTMAGPMLTHLHDHGEPLRAATLRLCGYFLALAAVPAAFFGLAGAPVVTLLYGKAFTPAGLLIVKLAVVPILTYLSLMIGQALITVHHRAFGPLYLGFAALQIAALVVARHSVSAIITALYVVQGSLLIAMLILLAGLRSHGAHKEVLPE